MRIEYGIPLRSLRLGLIGKADVVEFHRIGKGAGSLFLWSTSGGSRNRTTPTRSSSAPRPVCLEEMLSVPVAEGALFYGRTRKAS